MTIGTICRAVAVLALAAATLAPTAALACLTGEQFRIYNRDGSRYIHCVCEGSGVFGSYECHMH